MKYCIKILLVTLLLCLTACAEGLTGMERVTLTEGLPQEFSFTPAVNGVYSVCLLPQDVGSVRAELLLNGMPVAFGTNPPTPLGARLTAETRYTLRLTGSGTYYLEFARETLSRSVSKPLKLADGGEYAKLIARDGDVHWYEMTAESDGAALIACIPDGDLSPAIHLFSKDGALLTASETLPSGTALLSAELAQGQTVLIRISSEKSGKYLLTVRRGSAVKAPEAVLLGDDQFVIDGHSSLNIHAKIMPADASDLLFFDVADPRVAEVTLGGKLLGIRPGQTAVTAIAYGGARSAATVEVRDVPVSGLRLSVESPTLCVGDTQPMVCEIEPENAIERNIRYSVSDETVLRVNGNALEALSEGTAVVTASLGDVSESVEITVRPAPRRTRALLIGEQNYASTVEQVRTGSVLSVSSVESLLNTASYSCAVQALVDPSRDEIVSSIREFFGKAADGDVSILYLTCHGFYRGGMTFFAMTNGSVLSAQELLTELEAVQGDVVLLADCCGSGGIIGAAGDSSDILKGIHNVFSGSVSMATARSQRLHVLASAYLNQDSYRIRFTEDDMSTVFARVLCDAMGWSIDRAAISSMNADANYNREITMSELARYARRRADWYLALAGDYAQTICAYPEGDPFVIFQR